MIASAFACSHGNQIANLKMIRPVRQKMGALVIAVLILASSTASAQSLEVALTRIHDRYDAMQSLQAKFSQVTSSTYLDDSERFSGTLLVEGDQYRIEMDQQILVSNTILTWVYNRLENQVLLNDYEQDETIFSLTAFLTEFDTAYSVRAYQSVDGYDVVSFSPADPLSAFRDVTIRADDGVIVQMDVLDINDVKMHFELTDIEFNPDIPDGSFLFSIPEGAEVIDLREY